MQVEQSIKKQLTQGWIFIAIGIGALILGAFRIVNLYMMIGLAVGFIPVGIGTIIILKRAESSQAMQRNIEIEQDERNQFVRNWAGAKAFWASYWVVFILVLLGQVIEKQFDLSYLMIGLLIIMPILYFGLLGWGMKKY